MSAVPRAAMLGAVMAAVLLALTACPRPQPGQGAQQAASTLPPADPLAVVLVLTELGVGDGSFARQAHAELLALETDGLVDYTPVGTVPEELSAESAGGDIGLPSGDPAAPGWMDLASAELLLGNVPDCELLVLTTPLLIERAITGLVGGEFSTDAILVLDNDGFVAPEAQPPVPVYVVQYSIRDVAFLSGAAAAQSSINSMFIAMAVETDPQAEEYLAAVTAGARFQSSGATVATITVPVDAESGYVTPELFRDALRQVRENTGPYFQSNHYLLNLGRATPSVILGLSGDPENAYVIGAYADYRPVRPARVIGCAEKRPGHALDHILRAVADVDGLADLAGGDGIIELGLAENAVGFTDFEYYSRYNPDSDDIEQVVERLEALIRAGELDYEY